MAVKPKAEVGKKTKVRTTKLIAFKEAPVRITKYAGGSTVSRVSKRGSTPERDESFPEKMPETGDVVRYSVSQVRQGDKRFFTLSIYSDILAKCCFATSKDEDPTMGFQRVLDKKRAQDIANYIDNDVGTIPSSIVLSAQSNANFSLVGGGKTAQFTFDPHSFLIIDGQHRVFGYSLAKTQLRVPVVVYEKLTPEEEARLFIDINTKQRPVPKELLLAIRSLAKTESDTDAELGEIFDFFDADKKSALLGLMSATKKAPNKISRVTFNAGLRPHLQLLAGRGTHEIYEIWNAYFHAVLSELRQKRTEKTIASKTVFRAFCDIFPDCASKLKDKFGKKYTADNFAIIISPIFSLKPAAFITPKANYSDFADDFRQQLKSNLTL